MGASERHMESSDSELGLVEAAKAQRATKRTPPRPLPPTATAAAAEPPPASHHSSDSEEGFDLIAAAMKQQRSGAARQPASPQHSHAASASPAAGGSPRVQALRPTRSSPPTGTAGSNDSDSDGQDMVTLARQHGRQAKPAATAAPTGPASPAQRPVSGVGKGSRRELNHSISLAPAVAEVQETSAAPAPPAATAAQPAPPARSQPTTAQPSRSATVVVHEGVPVPPTLLDLAAGQLPQLPVAEQEDDEQPASLSGQPFAFSAGHSRQASSLQGAMAHSPRASSQHAAGGSSRSPSRLATTQAARSEGSSTTLHAQAAGGAVAASLAPSSPGLPLASLADLGDVLGSVADDLKSSLRCGVR